jgi:ABC-type transport system involved in multi-copper enzyme maturation permease subunit/large-conductance mechanosensitive channel
MIWIFMGINTLLIFGAVSSDSITIGGGIGSVHKNSPFVIQNYYGVMSLICLLMTTAFMNASANRDFQYGMYQFIFSSPIKKNHYYFGKFIGAVIISVIPLLGVSLGALLGPLMPWTESERYGVVILQGHWMGILAFGIPNTIINGVILYVLAINFRSSIVSFVGAMLIIVLYGISSGLVSDIEKEWIAIITDPFGFRPFGILSKYMTVAEKNNQAVAMTGIFLINRLIWVGIAITILLVAYKRFSFTSKKEKAKKEKQTNNDELHQHSGIVQFPSSSTAGKFTLSSFLYMINFETKSILRNPTFIIITILGLLNLIGGLIYFTGGYGADQYPVTYDVVDTIRGNFNIFLIAIITFYSGLLVWKERDAKFNEIADATPVKTSLLFLSKLFAMINALGTVLLSTILLGMLAQTMMGYYDYKPEVYFHSLFFGDLLSYSFWVVSALLIHYLINNRYIAYFAFITFIILNSFLWGVFEVETNMVKFAQGPSVTYSDMNGFGPFTRSEFWFNVYWFLFCVILCFIIQAFYIRGQELKFSNRFRNAIKNLKHQSIALVTALVAFLICGGFVFYNTKVLNKIVASDEVERIQVDYETHYKKYEFIAQPKIYKVNHDIEINPQELSLSAKTTMWVKNTSGKKIDELHFTMPTEIDSVLISINDAKLKLRDNRCKYRIYSLNKVMQPNDSLRVEVTAIRLTKGFENQVSFTKLTQNGTFFNNGDICPSIGYNEGFEISDKNDRVKYKLPKKRRSPILNEGDTISRMKNYVTQDADWVDVETTISTSEDQIAIAPGSLIKEWKNGNRRYFQYKVDQPSLNFYSFISARYEVERKMFNGISMEVYYHKPHVFNVPNMMKSIVKSINYYTKKFGKYYHKQCRIIEFPRYASFAQAFPGTMPYSEGIGFITDLRDVKEEDIDFVFYVVAHEMAHQYWAHQLCGAKMQGSEWMSEGFSQYSALMVMEKEYGKDKMKKFLNYEMDGYLRGRSTEFEAERPIYKTEGQSYIHYQKASVLMYYLKEMIGEDNVNKAMKNLLEKYAYKKPPYATSLDAVREFRKVTPDSLQYLISDMFENITIFSNRVAETKVNKSGSKYVVSFSTISEKYLSDSLGREKPLPLNDYIDIGVFAKSEGAVPGKPLVMQRLKLTKEKNEFKFETTEEPYRVGIDPYNYLIDRIADDNLKKVRQ